MHYLALGCLIFAGLNFAIGNLGAGVLCLAAAGLNLAIDMA